MTGHLVMIVFLLFRDPFHDRSLNSGEGKGVVMVLGERKFRSYTSTGDG